MAGLAAAVKVAILDALNKNDTYQGPAALYIGLHTGDPGADGTANELDYTDYERQSIAFVDADASGSVNSADILFPETDEIVGDATHFSVHSSASGANFVYSGTLTGDEVIAEKRPKIAAGALVVSL